MTIEGNIEFKDLFKMTVAQWKAIALKIKKWRAEDFKKGLFQNGRQKLPYLDRKYARYKANQMNRFSDGKRLKRYASKSVQNSNSQFVDMRVTGELIDNERVLSVTTTGLTYLVADGAYRNTSKVIGNRRYGREMNGLNDKNKRLVKVEIIKLLKGELKKKMMKQLKITVTG